MPVLATTLGLPETALGAKLDFATMLTVAPEGLKPTLRILRDGRRRVLAVLNDVEDLDEIDSEDLPEGYEQAVETLVLAGQERCTEG